MNEETTHRDGRHPFEEILEAVNATRAASEHTADIAMELQAQIRSFDVRLRRLETIYGVLPVVALVLSILALTLQLLRH